MENTKMYTIGSNVPDAGDVKNISKEFDDAYDDELYEICARVEEYIRMKGSELPQKSRPQKRIIEQDNNSVPKKVKCGEICDTESITDEINEINQVKCNHCEILVREKYFATHSRSKLRKNNISLLHKGVKVSIDSAFGKRVISYKINEKVIDSCESPEILLNSIKNEIMVTIQNFVKKYICK